MSDKTLLDIALGTGDPDELSPEDLERGLASRTLSPTLISNMWQRISTKSQENIMEILRQQERLDLPPGLIPKMIHSKVWTRKIRVDVALWLLRQQELSEGAAKDVLERGVYKTRGIPVERFFKACMALKPHLKRWSDDGYIGTKGCFTPLYALGRDVYFDPTTAAGLAFRKDAGEYLRAGVKEHPARVIRAIGRACIRMGESAEKDHQLISRSVCPKAMMASILFGHPDIDAEHKVYVYTYLCNKDLVPLDNYLQLGTIPKEMFPHFDLREHCRQSEHYVKQYFKHFNP